MHTRYQRDEPPTSRGAITAMHPHAAHAARDVLREGGSAHDAALTALATITVAEPFMSGLGGHGALLVAPPDGAPYVLDASARGPSLPPNLPAPPRGVQATPVPHAIAGWIGLHDDGATRPWNELLAPAIQAAREGLPVAWYTALMIAAHARLVHADPAARSIFLADHDLPPQAASSSRTPGDLLIQRDLADTLERVARHGLQELTLGETASRIASHMATHGGFVTPDDLSAVTPARPSGPLSGHYRGFTVHAGPTASAAASLIEMLHILEHLDPNRVPLGSAAYYAALADAQRAAFLDRNQHGDPDVTASPLDAYQDPNLGALRHADLQAAAGKPLPTRDLRSPDYPHYDLPPTRDAARDGASTTHVNVAAPDGTLITATFTLGYPFGSGIVVPGTGLLLGNTLYQFHDDAAHPNGYAAGKRAVWNGAPTILTHPDGTRIAIGAPGGPKIPGALAQVLVAHLAYGLSPQRATEVPRIFQSDTTAFIDDRVDPHVIDALRSQGRDVRPIPEGPFQSNFARPSLLVRHADGSVQGGVDAPRLATFAPL